MRVTSVAKLMVGWFLAAAALGAAGYYVVRPVVLEANNVPGPEAVTDENGEIVSKRFSAPKLTVSRTQAQLRRGGSTVGKRPRRVKKKPVEDAPAPDAGAAPSAVPDPGGAPPISNPTTTPVENGGNGTATAGGL